MAVAAVNTAPAVVVERQGVFTHLRLNRADAGNALSKETIDELTAELRAAERSRKCRALILSAAGGTFCSGVDLGRLVGDPDEAERVSVAFWELLTAWADSPLMTVATVARPVTGGGVGLVSACDLVFAGPAATFRLTELTLGLVPALIMPFVLARLGEQKLMRLAMSTEEIDAQVAVEQGLVDELLTDPGEVAARVLPALRRTSRAGYAELKACRRKLRPLPKNYPGYAIGLLRRTVEDPAFVAKIGELHRLGLIP
ncbi:enoyl-CoA hydratase/isomerase family protein [Amycolatopsis nigrescens]|uniref:enoyl-CoA hydratase/isomerase family protein n=1 Tax=Amycolatopsis nigrescens TaxID=381445 RepID=UPI00036A73F5|nr:enoyl-CoA hydratase/isomerase family protein [Amycolatopsis nigrescens]